MRAPVAAWLARQTTDKEWSAQNKLSDAILACIRRRVERRAEGRRRVDRQILVHIKVQEIQSVAQEIQVAILFSKKYKFKQ